jgi:hypothetical protein
MLRTFATGALAALALAASSRAGNVQVNFSGGSGAPLAVTLPHAVSFTVTGGAGANNVAFIFQSPGNFLGGIAIAAGSVSYAANGGSPLSIDRVGSIAFGVATPDDLLLFRMASPAVALGDVLLLSSGSVATIPNITAPAPPSGLYSAIIVDAGGAQIGVGRLAGDFDDDGDVDGRDFLVWQRGDSPRSASHLDFADWKANFGASFSATASSTPVPEPHAIALLILTAFVAHHISLSRVHRVCPR